MLIGYARVSSAESEDALKAQAQDLTATGCEDVFCDKVSSLSREGAELERAVRFARKDDTLVATKLDRLASSISNLVELHNNLAAKGAYLRILSIRFDTATPTGQLMLQAFQAAAELEKAVKHEKYGDSLPESERPAPSTSVFVPRAADTAANGLSHAEAAAALRARPREQAQPEKSRAS